MDLHPTQNDVPSATVYPQYQRYERFVRASAALALLLAFDLLSSVAVAVAAGTILAALAWAWRRYHRAVHRFIGAPGKDTHASLEVWGTLAESVLWTAVTSAVILWIIQLFG